jgi:diguanylate cyclase (GGDEF)-like protein
LSLRARLALVLAGIMAGPVVAAAVTVGVIVPRAADRAVDADLRRAVATTGGVLAERCRELGDLARASASALAAGPAVGAAAGATGTDVAAARSVLTREVAGRDGVTALLVDGGHVVAGAGPLATGWDPTAAGPASCSARRAPAGGQAAALVESVDLPASIPGSAVPATTISGTTAPGATRVIALAGLDDAALRGLRDGLDLGVELVLLPGPAGTPVASTLPADRLSGVRPALVAAGGITAGGRVAGWRWEQRALPPQVPYAVLALTRPQGSRLQGLLLGLLLAATMLLIVMLLVLTSRLTAPLARLTAVARKLGGGDLSARTGLRGTDEVGTLAAAFDTMADDLQSTVGELTASQHALSDTFARFGEALGATHDLDALLRTVVEAAMRGSDARLGAAYLGDANGLEQRSSSAPDDTSPSADEALAGLADLADDAVRRGELVVTDLVDAAGPALAVPLCRQDRVIGALAVARAPGAAPFDGLAIEAVSALASHAGTAVANVRAHEETSRQSVTDPLTGAGNFRHLTSTMAKEVERATRFNRPLSLLMLDLDHFKQVNDTAGHAFGDTVLREFARRLSGCLRDVDVVARYGGEEFVVVLPETASEGASAVANRIVEAVRRDPFRGSGASRTVTVSIGVAAFPDHGGTSADLMRAADAALYSAKHAGRDRWCLATGTGGKGVAVAQTG